MSRKKNKSAAEKYEHQKALARERQRRRLAKMTEEEKERKRKYDRERQARLREQKIVKGVADMTPREHRIKKKCWRKWNKNRSEKKKLATAEVEEGSEVIEGKEESRQKVVGRKQIRKDRAKAYRKIEEQRNTIKKLERSLEKYKKRLQREKSKKKEKASPSPRKLVSQTIGSEKVSPNVRKQLFLGFTLQKQLKHQIKKIVGSKKQNQQVHKVIGNEILKKYRVQSHFRKIVPYTANKTLKTQNSITSGYTRKTKSSIREKLSATLRNFFEDDRISRVCPGKKDVVRNGSIKKQRRVLLEPLKVLHKQFQDENNCKISLTSFTRSRPFWVTFPKLSDRETCACIKHTNMQLLVNALKQTKVIKQKSPTEIISAVVCSSLSEQCMLGTCNNCRNKEIPFDFEEDFKIKYFKWKLDKIEKEIKNVKKTVKRTIKSKEVKKVSRIQKEFKQELKLFKKHVYYNNYLSEKVKEKTEGVKSGELVFRLDFSENYVTKFAKEIQSVHFGASKKQICLNTGVRYALVNGAIQTECFASVSDNIDHQAHAVWAHMIPMLERSSEMFPDTTIVHFFSDSPSSQYRNRWNMHLFKEIVPKYFPNLAGMTWNFTEAGHGKGPMDGVGGTLKREADRKVLYGKDIISSSDFVSALKDCNITLYEVPAEEVDKMKKEVATLSVPPIKGIMQVHQVVYSSSGVMHGRKLICFDCPPSVECDHFHILDIFEPKVTKPTNCPQAKKKRKITVEEIYTTSEDEGSIIDELPPETHHKDLMADYGSVGDCSESAKEKLESGNFVLVKLEDQAKKSKFEHFIGVCQTNVVNREIEIMFMKSLTKDRSLYFVDENDVSTILLDQIVAVLPTPILQLKGNRVYYKFDKAKRS